MDAAMWKIILFLLIAGYTKAFDDGCDLHSYLVCGIDDVPENFPETREELYHDCKVEIKFLKCVIRTEQKCKTDPEFIQVHHELLAATKEMCNKDSPNHSAVVENLACVKPIFEDNSVECYHSYPGHKKMKKYAKALRREGISPFTKSKEARKDCMKGLYAFVCEALKIEEKCGTSAMKAFIKIIHTRTRPLTESCNYKIKDYLLDIVRIVKLEQVTEDFEEHAEED